MRRRPPTVIFQILRCDEAAQKYIGYAQGRVRAIVESGAFTGVPAWTRTWLVDGARIGVHAVEFMGDWVVKLSLAAQMTTYPIALRLDAPTANNFVVLSSNKPTYSELDTGVPADLGPLPGLDGSVGLIGVRFDDAPQSDPNVSAVLDTPLFRNCLASIARDPATTPLEGSNALFVKLFDDRHAAALIEFGRGTFATKTPSSVADVFNEYASLEWTPIYFWKEAVLVDGVSTEEVWALCGNEAFPHDRHVPALDTLEAQANIPFTGNYKADRYPAHALYGTIAQDNLGRPLPPPHVRYAQGCVLLKARLIDLYNAKQHPKRSVNEPYGAAITFTYWGREFHLPVTPPEPLPGAALGTQVYETSDYRIQATWLGRIYLDPQGTRRVEARLEVSNIGVGKPSWAAPAPGPSSAIAVPSYAWMTGDQRDVMLASAESAHPGNMQEYFRTAWDLEATQERTYTEAFPLEAAQFVDLRATLSPSAPAYVSILGTGISQRAATIDGFNPETMFLNCSLWSDPFTGVYFRVTNERIESTVATRNAIGAINSAAVNSRLHGALWGRMTESGASGGSQLVATVFLENGRDVTSLEVTPVTWRASHRGATEELGQLRFEYTNDLLNFAADFVPSSRFAELGLTEYHIREEPPYQGYDATIHVEAGYVEKSDLAWATAFPPFAHVQLGRYYKGIEIAAPTFDAPVQVFTWPKNAPYWATDSEFTRVGVVDPPSGNIPVEQTIRYYFDPEALYTAPGLPHLGAADPPTVRLVEYPLPTDFYLPESQGGEVIDGHRLRFKAVAIYWPNLKNSQPGFCLLKLGPDDWLVRATCFLARYTVEGIGDLKAYVDKLHAHSAAPIYSLWEPYRTAIAELKAATDAVYAVRSSAPPPGEEEFRRVQGLARAAVRASYEVVVNNFASRDLMDPFISSAVIVPYRS